MKKITTIFMALLICTAAFADRPKVGVVLCGGGAKGAAHVGVLKILEENNIPIDYIAGTSMGAIMGGLYAIGYSADELHDLILNQDWDMVMNDRVSRKDMSYEHKKGTDKYLLRIPFGLGDYSKLSSGFGTKAKPASFLSNIPMAIVNGQNIYNLFTKLSVGYQDSVDFNRMPIPFACVAVDLIKKEEVVFHSGNFVDAIRSSMAIPGYFAPVRLGDKVLVDGGSLNNYPVDVIREMGADIVIGVLLGGSEPKKPEIENIGDIASEMMDMYLDVKLADHISKTDILITPSVQGYNVLSFDTASLDSLMVNGERAALDKEDELKQLKSLLDREGRKHEETFVGPKQIKQKYAKARHLDKDTVTIGSVSVKGLNEKDVSAIMKKSVFKPGSRLTGKMIDDQIEKYYSTGAFESVTYALKGTEDPYDMELNFVMGRSSSAAIGVRFDSEEIASVILNLGLNNNTLSGHRFDLTAKLAYNMQAQATYSYGFQGNTQFNFAYKFRSSDLNMFNQELLNNLKFTEHSLIANFSTQRTKYWHSDIGAMLDMFNYKSFPVKTDEEFFAYDLNPARKIFLRAYVDFSFDSMDREYFPTYGLRFEIEGDYINGGIFEDVNKHPGFATANMGISGVIPFGERFAIIPSLNHRSIFGKSIPVAYMNLMGGFEGGRYMDQQIPFGGFTYARVFDSNLTSVTIDTRMRIFDNHYAFGSAACAYDYHHLSDITTKSPILGFRLGYSYDSFIGPLSANLMWSNYTRKLGAYLSIGYSF